MRIDQLAAQVRRIEGFFVELHCDNEDQVFEAYRQTRPSPPFMTGNEWVLSFQKQYPDIEVTLSASALTLGELRTRHSP